VNGHNCPRVHEGLDRSSSVFAALRLSHLGFHARNGLSLLFIAEALPYRSDAILRTRPIAQWVTNEATVEP